MGFKKSDNPSPEALKQREWRSKNPEKVIASRRAYDAKNRDRLRIREREYRARWRVANPEKSREKNHRADLKRWCRIYGITVEEFYRRRDMQGGKCAICNQPPDTPRLYIDHNHVTGAFRGLLCNQCNGALGWFRDNPTVLRAAAEYVERHNTNA